jgi:hypothetical protein
MGRFPTLLHGEPARTPKASSTFYPRFAGHARVGDFATSENAAMRLAVTCGKPALGQLRSVPSPAGDIGATLEQAGGQAGGDERKLELYLR